MLRFNKMVFWPEWAETAIENFIDKIDVSTLRLSIHANRKLEENKTYRKRKTEILAYISSLKLETGKIFEFYLDASELVKKICHRDSLNSKYDIILVVSDDIIVTFYINRNHYVHSNLDRTHYVEGEENERTNFKN